MSNLERAISDALDDHAKAETRISRWEETLNAAIYNGVIDGLAEKTFVTEKMKVSTAILASSLAQDFVDDLPNYLSRKANGASLDRTVYADALTPELAATIANNVVQKAIVGMMPIIRKREDDLRKMQPPMVSNVDVVPQIDLGAYAKEQSQRFAVEDARKAGQPASRGGYVDPALDPLNVMKAGEHTAATSKYPAKKVRK